MKVMFDNMVVNVNNQSVKKQIKSLLLGVIEAPRAIKRCRWNSEDKAIALEMSNGGAYPREIAKRLNRTRHAVSTQLWKMKNEEKQEVTI